MKKASLIIFLIIVHINVNGQESRTQTKLHPIADSVAKQMCDCLMANKDSITTKTKLFSLVTTCITKYSTPVMDKLLIENGYEEIKNAELRSEREREIGRKIGQKVMVECDGMKEIIDRLKQIESKKLAN